MLKLIRVRKYRAFSDFTLHFQAGAYIMGPNNAGKTSLLTALRLVQTALRYAWVRKASEMRTHGLLTVRAYPLSLREYPSLSQSVRHEFRDDETIIEVHWSSGALITIVWPAEVGDVDTTPYFYLKRPGGFIVETPALAKKWFPRLGVIPPLVPVEHEETLLDESYVRLHVESRLASRHFRNQLNILKRNGEWGEFCGWIKGWIPDLTVEEPSTRAGALDVFYLEPGSRVPKELTWAGDGIQIWLQILYHVFRNRDCGTLILDEPEVFLHPDLQRRLIALLDSTGQQIVMATHSAEVAAEADPRLVALVDKSSKRASRAKSDEDLELLTHAIGSSFNLRLAKAIRAKRVVFVEGKDMRVLRAFAKTLGLLNVAAETGVAIIQLGGFSSWDHLPAFAWLSKELLPGAVEIAVVLDRDYHSDVEIGKAETSLADAEIKAHIWQRKELESYLVTPSVIARLSGADETEVSALLMLAAEEQRYDVAAQLAAHVKRATDPGIDLATVLAKSQKQFDSDWADTMYRLGRVNAKNLLSSLNTRLRASRYRTVSTYRLAREHRPEEISEEMRDLLSALDGPLARDE